MSRTGQQLPLSEFRSNYNQQISHDVPTQSGIWFNITTLTNPHYTGSLNKRQCFILCPVQTTGWKNIDLRQCQILMANKPQLSKWYCYNTNVKLLNIFIIYSIYIHV